MVDLCTVAAKPAALPIVKQLQRGKDMHFLFQKESFP